MKKIGKFTTLGAFALTLALFLGACSNDDHQAQTSTSSSAQTSSSSAKKTSSSLKNAEASSSLQPSPANSVSSATDTAKLDNNQASLETAKQVPVQPAYSDYAYLAGTWANDEGVTISINADGTTNDGSKIEQYGEGSMGIRSKEGFGAVLLYAVAGQEFPESIAPKEYTAKTDISKERLVISQSVNDMAYPFYRVD